MFTSMLFIVPAIVLVGFVLPLWLVLHYVTVWRQQKRSGCVDDAALSEIESVARRLEDRIATLERVLDTEDPAWREKA
ncbi:MAG: envelope stress response membrane protein PspB [Alphaproteobacteria bacterium]|nr:envelope stress response membrane protein PspB [Alphaproteobacteria bacterium]